MSTTWSSGSAFPPAFTADKTYFQDGQNNFTFVDFLPECRESGGIFSQPQYDTFRTLMERANHWLYSNPHLELKTCESVEFKVKKDHADSEKMVYLVYGETSTRYIRGLRLWVAEKSGKETTQQIGYFNLIPQRLKKGGVFSSAIFESLDDVVRRFNFEIQANNPIPGRIITIESQEIKLPYTKEVDPDLSYWIELGSSQTYFLFVIRIFYELCTGLPEEIGITDFVPATYSNGGVFSLPKYEPFSNIVEKASQWCTMNQDLKICNAQSIEIKLKRGNEVDTKTMSYIESGSMNTYYVRILRLLHTNTRGYKDESNSPLNIERITCKTFPPVQLTSGLFIKEFETLQETKDRVSAWVKATGVQVISAETVAMRMYTGTEANLGTEATFTHNRAERSEFMIFVLRLYINGSYIEPPLEMLPPVPILEDQQCCILS